MTIFAPRVRTPILEDMKLIVLVESFLVYKIMTSVFLTGVGVEEIILTLYALT